MEKGNTFIRVNNTLMNILLKLIRIGFFLPHFPHPRLALYPLILPLLELLLLFPPFFPPPLASLILFSPPPSIFFPFFNLFLLLPSSPFSFLLSLLLSLLSACPFTPHLLHHPLSSSPSPLPSSSPFYLLPFPCCLTRRPHGWARRGSQAKEGLLSS